jgi:6-methylsalicylate decarboxylase
MPTSMPTDVHQHLLPEDLIAALSRRTTTPRISRGVLHLAGEPPSPFDPADHDATIRAGLDDVDRIVISLSSALGIETLPAEEAEPLLDAFNRGILELGEPFVLWGAVGLEDPRPEAVDDLLDRGALGISLPATTIADRRGLRRVAPLLDRLEARGAPLFVHPGPAYVESAAPSWWPALTSYVADMSAAWHAFATWGRSRHPQLRIVYAMLAGGAPLHAERLFARGGPARAIHDPLAWFDISSYGPLALDAMIRAIGIDRLLYGSDRPVAAPPATAALGAAAAHALTVTNPEWAFSGRATVAVLA